LRRAEGVLLRVPKTLDLRSASKVFSGLGRERRGKIASEGVKRHKCLSGEDLQGGLRDLSPGGRPEYGTVEGKRFLKEKKWRAGGEEGQERRQGRGSKVSDFRGEISGPTGAPEVFLRKSGSNKEGAAGEEGPRLLAEQSGKAGEWSELQVVRGRTNPGCRHMEYGKLSVLDRSGIGGGR